MFNSHLPTLDLHGEIASVADLLISNFLKEHHKLGNSKVLIIHGIGTGILKKAVHDSLAKNKLVLNYRLDMFNIGTTIVEIKIDNIDEIC